MDYFGIASASMAYSQAQIQQSVSLSVTKKAMDSQEAQAVALLEMLPSPASTPLTSMPELPPPVLGAALLFLRPV